jgi:hypothetical protein
MLPLPPSVAPSVPPFSLKGLGYNAYLDGRGFYKDAIRTHWRLATDALWFNVRSLVSVLNLFSILSLFFRLGLRFSFAMSQAAVVFPTSDQP